LAPIVRVIVSDTEEMLGEMPVKRAIEEAIKRELDLVEVAPEATPPVCKIMDLGQFFYQKKKILQKNKKKQKKTEIKTLRIGFRIGDHDLNIKEKQARKFLEEGNSVRIVMMFRGREMSHMELGVNKIKVFIEKLSDVAKIEQEAKQQGTQISAIFNPKK